MAEDPYRLPCVPLWEEGIYRIEISDPALGYDPATGKDGVANIQGLQLGNRTLWLKALLEAGHAEDGSHALRNADFMDTSAIPESCLALDTPTAELMAAIAADSAAMRKLWEEAAGKGDVDLSLAGMLRTLIPLAQQYAAVPCAYELFTDSVSLRDPARTMLLKEIAGDDSIDVLDSGGFHEGGLYVLCDEDGGRPEMVTILTVLTQRRIRCTKSLSITRRRGRLEATSLVLDGGHGTAACGWWYVSRRIDALAEAASGRLMVRRDRADLAFSSPAAFRMPENTDRWEPLFLPGTEDVEAGRVEDVFAVPGGTGRLLLNYPSASAPYRVYSLALIPDVSVERIEYIRRPDVVQARYARGRLDVQATPYAALYAIPQRGLDIETMTDGRIEIRRVPTTGTACALRLDRVPASLRLRYVDRENSVSRWSAAADVVEV